MDGNGDRPFAHVWLLCSQRLVDAKLLLQTEQTDAIIQKKHVARERNCIRYALLAEAQSAHGIQWARTSQPFDRQASRI